MKELLIKFDDKYQCPLWDREGKICWHEFGPDSCTLFPTIPPDNCPCKDSKDKLYTIRDIQEIDKILSTHNEVIEAWNSIKNNLS